MAETDFEGLNVKNMNILSVLMVKKKKISNSRRGQLPPLPPSADAHALVHSIVNTLIHTHTADDCYDAQ